MDGPSTPRDASEADVAEQHAAPTGVDDEGDDTIDVEAIPADVPEADAIEQSQEAPIDEDD